MYTCRLSKIFKIIEFYFRESIFNLNKIHKWWLEYSWPKVLKMKWKWVNFIYKEMSLFVLCNNVIITNKSSITVTLWFWNPLDLPFLKYVIDLSPKTLSERKSSLIFQEFPEHLDIPVVRHTSLPKDVTLHPTQSSICNGIIFFRITNKMDSV